MTVPARIDQAQIDQARIALVALGPGEIVLGPVQAPIALVLLAPAVIGPKGHVPLDRNRVRIALNRGPRCVLNPVLRMQLDAPAAGSRQAVAMPAAQAATVLVVVEVQPQAVALPRIAAQRRVVVRRPDEAMPVALGAVVVLDRLLEVLPAADAAQPQVILALEVAVPKAALPKAAVRAAARTKTSRLHINPR